MSCDPELTERDKTRLTDDINEKLVKTICSKIMDESADDAQLISGILKQTLGDSINKALTNPSNEDRISSTITQAINASLSKCIDGPLLLYSILDNKESYQATKELLNKIFTNVYSKITDKSLAIFVKTLLRKLKDPPYTVWFKPVATLGGKKSKTMRKRKRKNKRSKTYRNRRVVVGGGPPGVLAAVTADSENIDPETIADISKNVGENISPDKIAEISKKVDAGIEQTDGEETKGMLGSMKDKMKGILGYGDENPEGDDTGTGQGTGSSVDFSDEKIRELNDDLINRLTKRIDETEDELLERLLNATYEYCTSNGKVILDNINTAIYDTISINNISKNTTEVIIVQAMYASSMDVQQCIERTYEEFRKTEIANGVNESSIKFVPTSPTFINNFLRHLKTRLGNLINL